MPTLVVLHSTVWLGHVLCVWIVDAAAATRYLLLSSNIIIIIIIVDVIMVVGTHTFAP
jgi:hypothetical protein